MSANAVFHDDVGCDYLVLRRRARRRTDELVIRPSAAAERLGSPPVLSLVRLHALHSCRRTRSRTSVHVPMLQHRIRPMLSS